MAIIHSRILANRCGFSEEDFIAEVQMHEHPSAHIEGDAGPVLK